MKISGYLLLIMLLLIASSGSLLPYMPLVESVTASKLLDDAKAIWLPEHTCSKTFSSSRCDFKKCVHRCSKEPYGMGKCRGNLCICTYFCKQPP